MRRELPIINHLLLLGFILAIIVSCNKYDELSFEEQQIDNITSAINSDSLEAQVTWLQNMGTRFAFANNHKDVAQKIKGRFLRMGYTDAKLDSFQVQKIYRGISYDSWQYNVIASLKGDTNPDSICIVCGHYDSANRTDEIYTFAPGANDNASGVAAVIEIARVMKKNNIRPQSTIRFIAFAAEEMGLLGSYSYASRISNPKAAVKMVLNNDMIAVHPENGNYTVNILDYPNSQQLSSKAKALAAEYTELATITNNTSNKASDSYPFSQYGFPAIFFMSAASDANYHTSNDLVDACNFSYCKEVVRLNAVLLLKDNL